MQLLEKKAFWKMKGVNWNGEDISSLVHKVFLFDGIQTWNEAATSDCFLLNTNINIKFGSLICSYIRIVKVQFISMK